MCTGLEAVLIGSALLGTAGSVASGVAQQRSAEKQASARNSALTDYLNKNDALTAEARTALDKRLSQEDAAPLDAQQPLQRAREDAAVAAIDRSPMSSPIPLSGNAPSVVARTAEEAQSATDAASKTQAANLARTRSFGDLLFEKGLSSEATGRDLGMINSFAQANARLLPIQQDLAQTSAASKGSALGTFGQIGSALGSLGSAAAGSGAFSPSAGANSLSPFQRAVNRIQTAPVYSPTPVARPINLGL